MENCFERLGRNKNASETREGVLLFLKFYCREFSTGVRVEGVRKPDAETAAAVMRERIRLANRACSRALAEAGPAEEEI